MHLLLLLLAWLLLCGRSAAAAATAAATAAAVAATFEPPVVVHRSFDGQHAWFSSLVDPRDQRRNLVLSMSLGGDGTPCPPPNRTQNCSMSLLSSNGGKSWEPFQSWSRFSPNEVMPLGDGSTFLTLPYRLKVDYATNATAASDDGVAEIDTAGQYRYRSRQTTLWHVNTSGEVRWPYTLVHSGSVVRLTDGSHLTTLYGHGSGIYRKWSQHAAVYFVRSVDKGKSWHLISTVPWQPAMGLSADGPGEPSTARLLNGDLLTVFRSDSTAYYWATRSTSGAEAAFFALFYAENDISPRQARDKHWKS